VHRHDALQRRFSEHEAASSQVEQQEFAPGESGRIVLRVLPANESPGRKELFADLEYSDPEPRQVRLTFKLDIPERQMTVSPPALIVFHPAGSSPTVQTLTVTDGRKKPFEITDIATTSDLITAVIGERTLTPTGEWSQTVQVTIPGTIPEGKHQMLLRISTTDPDYPELRVPIQLLGPASESESHEGHDHDHSPARPPIAQQPTPAKS